MSIHVALHHTTRYRYDRLVGLGPQIVRLRPAPHCRTPILSYSMKVEPAQHFVNWQQDPFANYLGRLVFPERTRSFEITIDLVAEMSVYNPFDFFLEEAAETFPFSYDAALRDELAPYLVCDAATGASPLFRDYLAGIDRAPQGTIDFLVALNQQLQKDIRYLVRLEPGVQTPEETLKLASGSCRDNRLAAGAAVPPPGPGRAFRVGLPDPVDARREIARRPQRHRGRLHRPACLVRGLPARRRLDRLRSDLGPAGRRRPHPARLHAAADQRRAGRGADRRMRGGVRARDGRHAHLRIAARDQALYRIAMGRRAGAGRGGRRATGGRRRAADPGRRAHLRLDRRSRRRRMEYRRARAHQARLRHLADPEAARRIRRGRLPAFRPGQVVPGRAVAALGVVGVLAQGRRAGLAGPGAVRRRARAVLLHHRGRAALHPRAGRAARFERRACASRFRGRLVLPVARTPAAGQRRPVRLAPGRRTGARAAAQGVRPEARHGDRLRAAFEAAAAIARAGRPALGNRPVVLPRRAHVPDPRRFADGLSPAARFAALGQRHRLPLPDRPGSVRAGRAAADRRGAARALPRRHRRAALPGRAGRLRRPAHGRRAAHGAAVAAGCTGSGRPRRVRRTGRRGCRPRLARRRRAPLPPIASNRPPGSRAPRCAPRSATACSTCSCRRWPRWRTISTCFPRSS